MLIKCKFGPKQEKPDNILPYTDKTKILDSNLGENMVSSKLLEEEDDKVTKEPVFFNSKRIDPPKSNI